MTLIPWQQARNLVVVDPDTGFQIPHVRETDPDQGWIDTWKVTPCVPEAGMEMQVIRKDAAGKEQVDVLPYTFIEMRDLATGQKFRPTTRTYCRFDLVDKRTGEVFREVAGGQAPVRVRDPVAWAAEHVFGPTF